MSEDNDGAVYSDGRGGKARPHVIWHGRGYSQTDVVPPTSLIL